MTDTRTKLVQQGARATIRMHQARNGLATARTEHERNDLLRRYDDMDAKRKAVIAQLIKHDAVARGFSGAVGTIDVSGAGDASVRARGPVRPVFGGRP